MNRSFTCLSMLVIAGTVVAGDIPPKTTGSEYTNQLLFSAITRNASGNPPPAEEYGTYVSVRPASSCGGSITIPIDIPKVLNDSVLNNGKISPNALSRITSSSNLGGAAISFEASLSMPVYDIDSNAPNGEVDKVYFNGHYLGLLSGNNNSWSDGSQTIPIEHIIFGGKNEILIDIDTTNAGWCMSTDWAAVSFDVKTPIVLAHGIGADRATWEDKIAPGFLDILNQTGILYERFSAGNNGTVKTNASLLKGKIDTFLQEVKAEEVNIIAHSKGGLDSQFLESMSKPFSIKSISTLSTPHMGSSLGDLSAIRQMYLGNHEDIANDPNATEYINLKTAGLMTSFGIGPLLPGLKNLTTQNAIDAIRIGLRGKHKNIYAIAANADLNNNNQMEREEVASLLPHIWPFNLDIDIGNVMWNVLRDVDRAIYLKTEAITVQNPYHGTSYTYNFVTFESRSTSSPKVNDLAVTVESGLPSYAKNVATLGANHTTVKSGEALRRLFNANSNL